VDNNIPSAGQYTTLQAAYDEASVGDTIFVCPSNANYAGINIDKRVTIIGTGWQPDGLDYLNVKASNISGSMAILGMGAQSKIIGLGGGFALHVHGADAIIKKCKISEIHISTGSIGLYISQCRIISEVRLYEWHLLSFTIANCIFTRDYYTYPPYYYFYDYLNNNVSIVNCTFVDIITLCPGENYGSATIMNNILAVDIIQNDATVKYNISGIEGQNCIAADYHTMPGSAATNAGNPDQMFNDLDGTRNDCGAYGGPTPFVDGGIPSLPAIYQISGDYVVGQDEPWQLEIKAKNNRD